MNESFDEAESSGNPAPPLATDKTSPGARVREARERAGYSLEQLASLTKLTRPTIDALERDDFPHLLEPVYVRGYYRKCAKVLGLPEQELVNVYEALVRPPPPSLPNKVRLATGDNLEAGRRLPLRFSVLAPLIAIAISATIWFWRGESHKPPVAAPVPVQTAPSQEVSAAASPPSAEAATPATTETPAPTAAVSPAAPAVTTAPGSPRMLLTFAVESWVRINDSRGSSMLSGTQAAGTTQVVEGVPPYTLVLGNATGAKLEFQGKTIDPMAYVKSGTTARFSVPVSP